MSLIHIKKPAVMNADENPCLNGLKIKWKVEVTAVIRRLCRNCGREMKKELLPDGASFFCTQCDEYTPYDELDMEAFCPACDGILQFCAKCGQGYFCNKCNALVSSRKVVWKKT